MTTDCTYVKQFDGTQKIRLYTHSHLYYNNSVWNKRKADYVIVDEDIIGQLSNNCQYTKDLKYITDRLIDDKKLTLILSNCPHTPKGRELHLAIRIGYYSGLRLSEILNLKTNDFNIDKNVRITTLGKGNKTVTAFLPVTFKSEVESFKELTINMTYVETTYSRILKRLGLISTFHSLRHSFATRLLKQGIAVQDVQKLLNHESIITTEKYLHVTFELKNDMEKLGY